MHKVAVTGVGMISPLGMGRARNWTNLLEGRSGIDRIVSFQCDGLPTDVAGEVRAFVPEHYFSRKDLRRADRFIQFAVAASSLALEDAVLEITPSMSERAGVYIGSGVGGLQTIETSMDAFQAGGYRRVAPAAVPRMLINLASGQVAIRFGLKGPAMGHAAACASGAHAIGEAFRLIKLGRTDTMLAGGSEAPLTRTALAGFGTMRALARWRGSPSGACRPFERDRTGFVLSEGAAVLVLENMAQARARGARIYCELLGYGATTDAYHITVPEPGGDGASRCMREALVEASLEPASVDYISAHGTATRYNDVVETRAVKRAFGHHARRVWISSVKSMVGHMLGAGSALEAAVCALAVWDGAVPPTINYDHPDPECDLDYVPNVARKGKVEYALSNSFGFGGNNAVLVMGRVS